MLGLMTLHGIPTRNEQFLKSKNHQIGTKTFTERLNNSPKGVGEISTKVKEGGLKVKLGM